MIAMTVADLVAVLGTDVEQGLISEQAAQRIADVVIDSRLAGPGSVFVAFDGEHVDGHDYVAKAWEQGAVAAITSRTIPGGPCLVVPDPQRALGQLGAYVVAQARANSAGGAHPQVIAITGSQGKTSTKDLLATILEQAGPTVAPHGSQNNEIGLPLTATKITEDTVFLVSEMGAAHIGDVAYLCAITPPDISVVLNVGHAHLGEFGGREQIAVAKGEIVEALGPQGIAVLNADDPRVAAMAGRSAGRVINFSASGAPDTDVWATDITADDLGRYGFTLHVASLAGAAMSAHLQLGVVGRHQVANAVAAAAAAAAAGVPVEVIATALTGAGPRSRWRMELGERADQVVVINDAYNANPDSMRAALEALAELATTRRRTFPGLRTWALLGEMLEMGESSTADHATLGRLVVELGISRLVVIGDGAKPIHDAALAAAGPKPTSTESAFVPDSDAAFAAVAKNLRPGDLILVKASRGIALERLAADLLASDLLAPDFLAPDFLAPDFWKPEGPEA